MNLRRILLAGAFAAAFLGAGLTAGPARAETAADLDSKSSLAIQTLLRGNEAAAAIAKSATAVLVFPNMVKAGLIFGGAYGEGELRQGEVVDGYYNSFTGSFGFQAGAQSYGYVVFLMNPGALKYLRDSHGWEIGVGPTVVVVNDGVARNLSSSTLKDDAYAFIFDQKGLMASVSIEGTKITRIKTP